MAKKSDTSVDNNTNARDHETTVQASNAITLNCLLVNVDQASELTFAGALTLLGGFGVIGETGTGIVQRVDEEQGRGTSQTTRDHVSTEPFHVTVLVALPWEHGLEGVTEGEIQGLSGEIPAKQTIENVKKGRCTE
jgi:hypothetical protein